MSGSVKERKSRPFTVRLSLGTERWIEREANRTHMSKGTLLQNLAEESIRTRRFPGIAFRGPEHDRRAWITGTSLDVWEVIEAYKSMGLEQLLTDGDLPERKVRLALSYYDEYTDEIDELISDNQRSEKEWHELFPSIVPLAE